MYENWHKINAMIKETHGLTTNDEKDNRFQI